MARKKRARKSREGPIDMDRELRRAEKEMARNKRLIEAGETYRSRKRTGPEKAPSHYKPMV